MIIIWPSRKKNFFPWISVVHVNNYCCTCMVKMVMIAMSRAQYGSCEEPVSLHHLASHGFFCSLLHPFFIFSHHFSIIYSSLRYIPWRMVGKAFSHGMCTTSPGETFLLINIFNLSSSKNGQNDKRNSKTPFIH